MKQITIIPSGGLANRMRALAGIVTLMQQYNKEEGKILAIWFNTWGLQASFHSLFEPLNIPGLELREASFFHRFTHDRPRRRNLWLPRIFQQFAFDYRLYEKDVVNFRKEESNILHLISTSNPYVTAYHELVTYSDELLRKLFRPIPLIMEEIDKRVSHFSSYTIGVHVRRTDNTACIEHSPIEAFFHALDTESAEHKDLKIYLATDSEEVKMQMRERYNDRIITTTSVADRNSVDGIRDGIADMYTLARTKKIYGSYGSSFSVMASRLGSLQHEICT